MTQTLKHSNEGFDYENYAKVAFIVGRFYDDLPDEFSDWDELAILIEQICIDWKNFADIRNHGEEGYIQEYAERILVDIIVKSND